MSKKVVDIADALGECLEEIEAGRLSAEECFELFPTHAAELRELLKTSQIVRQTPDIQPAITFQQRARTQLVNQLPAPASKYPLVIAALINQWMRLGAFRQRRRFSMAWLLIFVVAASVIAGGGTAIAADSAVPGDPLYSLDRSLEEFRVELTNSPEALIKLQLANAQERLTEAKKLANRHDDDTFQQALNSYGETMLAVASTLGRAQGDEQANLDLLIEDSLMEHDPFLAGLLDDDPDQDDPDGEETLPDDTNGEDPGEEPDTDPDAPNSDGFQNKGGYCDPDALDHPVAIELAITYSGTVSVTDVMDWFCGNEEENRKGMGIGQIMLALRTADLLQEANEENVDEDPMTYEDLLAYRSGGASWGHIWQCLNLNGNSDCKIEGFGEPVVEPTVSDEAGQQEGKSKGPPDHSNRPDEPPGQADKEPKGPKDKDQSNGNQSNQGQNNGTSNGNGKKNK